MALTAKQKRFVEEYLIDLNATRAYKTAYPKVKKDGTAAQAGSRMLRNVKVAEYIQKRMDERTERTAITQDMVLKELARLGFLDARKLFADDGSPLKIKEIDDDTAACITGIKVKEIYDDDGVFVGYEKEYKLADKKGPLELLGKHMGMFKDRIELSGSLETEKTKLDDLIQQMRGDE